MIENTLKRNQTEEQLSPSIFGRKNRTPVNKARCNYMDGGLQNLRKLHIGEMLKQLSL